MPGYLTSVLRTVIPAAWGWLVAWLVSKGWATPELAEELGSWSLALTGGVVVVATAVWYAVWRRVESHLPVWVRALVLGAPKAPIYTETTVYARALGAQRER